MSRIARPRFASPLSLLFYVALLVGLPAVAMADELDSGDTAWILASTALVLFMTIPGLALFYGGLVARRNVLSVLMQCLALTGLMTLLWLDLGYTLAFGTEGMVAGDAWSDYLPDSKILIADWRNPLNCGNYNVTTATCSGQNY